ncbi:MAG: isoprenyl transferase [Armatimonadetes bacterium]|nr:isoprenyl transferase [Armatimonadota bacterium]
MSALNRTPEGIPRHIAIIMDGNGRWAKQRGMPRIAGHRQGYKTVRRIVQQSLDLGVEALTLYTFSVENWKRPSEETGAIMRLIGMAARRELANLHRNGVRIIISGRLNTLSQEIRRALDQAMTVTRENQRLVLNLAINYGGRAEIVDAARRIAALVREGKLDPQEIDEETFSGYLYTPELPDPDLLIRTSGELRVSNFLLWQIAYTEIWVTPVLWPDFRESHLLEAVEDYARRQRKFGDIPQESKASV